MYRFKLLVSLFLLINILAEAKQDTLRGRVVDEAGKPICFANVFLKKNLTGAACDLDGRFSILCEQNDTVVFSALGYTSLLRPFISFEDTSLVVLPATFYELAPVTITATKKDPIETGFYDKSKSSLTVYGSPGKAILVMLDTIADTSVFLLTKVKFKWKGKNRNPSYTLRLRVGTFGLDSSFSDYIKEPIVFAPTEELDVSSYNIPYIQGKTWVGFEYIGDMESAYNGTPYSLGISCTGKVKTKNTVVYDPIANNITILGFLPEEEKKLKKVMPFFSFYQNVRIGIELSK